MNYRISLMIAVLASLQSSSCQEVKEQDYHMTIHVSDSDGRPLSGASAKFGMLKWKNPATLSTVTEEVPAPASDEDGVIDVRYKSIPHINGGPHAGAYVTKPMFYPTKETGGAQWQSDGSGRWKAELNVVLKSIKNPIPMYASNMTGGGICWYVRIPEIGKEYGYDLMLCDALPPLGGGKTADFFFKVEGRYSTIEDIDMVLKVRFPGEGEGLVEFKTPDRPGMSQPIYPGSQLQSGYEAPVDGYVPLLERHYSIAPGKPRATDGDWKRNFYFKCRSHRSPDGRVISHFGKIYGDFDFWGGNAEKGFVASFGWMCTYFNPTPGDRNVEFDVTRNLLPKTSGAGDKGGSYEERLPVTWP